MSPHLPGIFGTLAPVLNSYGYLAVGGLILVEDFGVPAPGETVLIAAAVYAGAGQLNIILAALIALPGRDPGRQHRRTTSMLWTKFLPFNAIGAALCVGV